MRRPMSLLPILILFLLCFGCLEENVFPSNKTEQVSSLNQIDLDSDGNSDYYVYNYVPFSANDMVVERQVTVSVRTSAVYTSYNENLTDVDLLGADQYLEEFSKARTQADMECGNNIGVSNVICSNTPTCRELCSAASLKCKKIGENYGDALADSILAYIKDNNDLRTSIMNTRKIVLTLRLAGDEERNEYLQETRNMVAEVADIYANPIYTNENFYLCGNSDFGVPYIIDAAKTIGEYETQNEEYTYRVLISIKPKQSTDELTLGGAGFVDSMLLAAIQNSEEISSRQGIVATTEGSNVFIKWDSSESSEEGYLVMYTFDSDLGPETVLQSLKTPEIKTRKMNLMVLAPTNMALLAFSDSMGNYYIAYGLATGLTLAAVCFVYTVLALIFGVVTERATGNKFLNGFRRAFGKTDIRWKTDIILAIVLLAGGYYIATVMTIQPPVSYSILESINFLLKSDMGMVSIALVFFGSWIGYMAIENFIKIIVLERAYGIVIRQERDLFLAKAGSLKDKLKELGKLIEDDTKEDFDVSKEYDIYASTKPEWIDELAKDPNSHNKALIEEQLVHVENAIVSLKERKRVADENWEKWKANIAKIIEEQGEIYASSLVTVPASLRSWALNKYVKESSAEGVFFERDALKKRRLTPEQLVTEMIEKELLVGAVVLKQGKILVSQFGEQNGTLQTALSLKLMTYLDSLAKNLGQHPPQSFVSVGGKMVVVMMKDHTTDAFLFMSREKFKDAIEQWKAKTKIFDTD